MDRDQNRKQGALARLAVFASGQGSNFISIVEACRSHQIPASVELLVASHRKAGALDRAKELGIPAECIDCRDYSSESEWDGQILETVQRQKIDWVVLAGYTRKLGKPLLQTYSGRIINTHPSLLPKYGGPGMYGHYVHEAVLAARESETGISVHVVTENYDEGPVLAQCRLPVLPEDTVESLSQRLRQRENQFYVEVIAKLLRGEILVP